MGPTGAQRQGVRAGAGGAEVRGSRTGRAGPDAGLADPPGPPPSPPPSPPLPNFGCFVGQLSLTALLPILVLPLQNHLKEGDLSRSFTPETHRQM